MKTTVIVSLVIVLGVSVAANVFFVSTTRSSSRPTVLSTNSANISAYPYLSKKIFSADYDSDLINNFLPLRKQIHALTDPYQDNIALYFEYLPTGTSIGINEEAEFTAASLLKVPVVMGYLRKKERLGLKDDSDVVIQQKELSSQYGDLYKRGAGATINLGDAVKLALQESDNTASFVLADQIPDEDFNYVYEGLDIQPATENNNPIITAQQYSSILKALFFSSILNKDDSQYILDLLTKTKFHNMLPSGIPADVPIAHKIGLIDDQIYSDCGIVYVPQRPYMLCIISKSDSATAKSRMHDISKAVYDYVSSYR